MSNETSDKMKTASDKARDLASKGLAGSRRAFDVAIKKADQADRRMIAWAGIGLAAIILLSVNLIASTALRNWQTDLTEDNLFTISDRTKKVLSKIKEPIDVKLYYTTKLGDEAPQFGNYFRRVRAMLDRYRNLSNGKLNIEFINPLPFSDAEDRAVAAGLRGLRLNRQGDQAYFGLVATNSTDDAEAIPFFTLERDTFLEYDLTKIVHTLANPKKKIIGLVTSLRVQGFRNPMTRQGFPPWLLLKQIREFYDIRTLSTDEEKIDDDIDTLLIIAPNNLTAKGAYAIDQFALRGGRILAFVDPVPEIGKATSVGQKLGDGSEFTKLLNTWGVTYDPKKVALDIANARQVQISAGRRPVVTEYVAWLSITKKSLDPKDALVSDINNLYIATPGYIAAVKGAKTKFQPIIQTSKNASTAPASKFVGTPDALGLLRSYTPRTTPLTLAARVSGEISSAFPDGKPKPKKTDDKKNDNKDKAAAEPVKDKEQKKSSTPKHLKSGKLNAILVADTDMLHDRFWVSVRNFLGQRIQIPTSQNMTFLMNALENLSGGEALSGLRGRGVKDRPFERVNQIRRNAERRFRTKEQLLVKKLRETEQKLAGLEKRGAGGKKVILSEKDRETIEKFRREMLGIRRELRRVKLSMRQDIDSLDTFLKFTNIAAVPLLIGFGGLAIGVLRRRRRSTT